MVTVDIEEFPPQERLEAWRGAAARLIHPMSVRTRQPVLAQGRIAVSDVYGLRTTRVMGAQSLVERSRRLIDPTEVGRIQLTMVIRGDIVLEQENWLGRIGSGQVMWYHSNQPYRLEALGGFELFHFSLAHRHVEIVQRFLSPHPATPLLKDAAAGQILAGFLHGVAQCQGGPGGHQDAGSLEDSLVHLVTTLGQEGEHVGPPQDQDIFQVALRFIRANARGTHLGPQEVAQACHVSVRQIHRIFAQHGKAVGSCIREERLEGAAEALMNPDNRGVTVREIADNWGFPSQAHFSRTFKTHFGQTPAQARSAPEAMARARSAATE